MVSQALLLILMITQIRTTELEPGLANYGLWVKSSSMPVYTVLLEHGCIVAFIYVLLMAAFTL